MMRWLINRMFDTAARRYDYDVSYMRAMYEASPKACMRFLKVAALARHREAAPLAASEAARLSGTLAEDCGPCTQLVADMAREKGVPDDQIAAIVTGDIGVMSADTALGYRFARAIIARLPEADELREEVRTRWGDKAVLDLTLGAQMSRTYSMIKAGLGFAKICGPIRIGAATVVPATHEAGHGD